MENDENKKETEEHWIPSNEIVHQMLENNETLSMMSPADKAKFLVDATSLFHAKWTERNRRTND